MSELEEQRERARAAREALIGKTVAGKYVLRALIGHGGMGAVYEAENVSIGKRFAIKFVDPEWATDEQVVSRFAREARAMSAVESQHIVTVFDAGAEDGRPYLVMELLRGEDLGQRLRRTRTVPVADALHVIAQVLKGLTRAHAAGIVHRDLKPDNVFLSDKDGDPLFAKIVDFGMSKIERPRASTTPMALTGRGTVLGTPLYMSPEQAQCSSDVDGRADVYSVGAILFECLTGRPPHVGESYEQVILSICMSDAPDVRSFDKSIPDDVADLVARALARRPEDRYPSAERMREDVEAIERGDRPRALSLPKVNFAKTLLSEGAPSASEDEAAKARSERVVVVEPTPEQRAQAKERLEARARASTPTPKASAGSNRLVVAAVAATFAGIGVTFGIIHALDKPPAEPEIVSVPTRATVTSAIATAAPAPDPVVAPPASGPASASAPTSAPAAPAASAPAAPAATGAPPPTGPRVIAKPTTSAKPRSSGLDIQRDLP